MNVGGQVAKLIPSVCLICKETRGGELSVLGGFSCAWSLSPIRKHTTWSLPADGTDYAVYHILFVPKLQGPMDVDDDGVRGEAAAAAVPLGRLPWTPFFLVIVVGFCFCPAKYVCMYVCMFVCTYVCMYVCMCSLASDLMTTICIFGV